MSTNRRGFLRGAATTALTLGGVPAQSARIAGSVVAGAATVGADRIANVHNTLGKTGGFPHETVSGLSKELQGLASGDLSPMLNRIGGMGAWRVNSSPVKTERYVNSIASGAFVDFSDVNAGKINFNSEARILSLLTGLPPNLPVLDLLDKETIQGLDDREINDTTREGKQKDISGLRAAISPLCNSDTTPSDLIQNFKSFFVNLGHNALVHPENFQYSGGLGDIWGSLINNPFGGISSRKSNTQFFGSSLGNLVTILEFYAQDDQSLNPMIERIKELSDQQKQESRRQRDKELDEQRDRNAEEAIKRREERARIIEREKASITPWTAQDVAWVLHVKGDCRLLKKEFEIMADLGLELPQCEKAAQRLNRIVSESPALEKEALKDAYKTGYYPVSRFSRAELNLLT